MNITTFWQLQDKTRDESGNEGGRQAELLEEKLFQLPPSDIIDYHEIFHDLRDKAYRANIWDVAYIIEGGCSDDGFMDFRAWLIGQGKEAYEAALENPDNIADYLDDDVFTQVEPLNYVASNAYERKTGDEDIPTKDSPLPELIGEFTVNNPELWPERYPKIYAMFKDDWE